MNVIRVVIVAMVLAGSVGPGAASVPILGRQWEIKGKPALPSSRIIVVTAKGTPVGADLTGDPSIDGATVQVIVNGAVSTSQTFVLPPGDRWRRTPRDPQRAVAAWKYSDLSTRLGFVSPVTNLSLSRNGRGGFVMGMKARGNRLPIDVTVPNPGTYAGVVIVLGTGETYCSNFGGVVGGLLKRNDASDFKIAKPDAEGFCPVGAPVCGDGVVLPPFEVCDDGNDAACPGLCGVNGLPCLCPICGDGVVDPGEVCDRPDPGSCVEGCSFACQCTVCGDGLVQAPVEECEGDADCNVGACAPAGAPNQCRCPTCGDGMVNLPEEQCDGVEDTACPGACAVDCTCP